MSPIRIIVRMPEPDCFLRYCISTFTWNFTSGKSHWHHTARASRGFKMVLSTDCAECPSSFVFSPLFANDCPMPKSRICLLDNQLACILCVCAVFVAELLLRCMCLMYCYSATYFLTMLDKLQKYLKHS